MDLTTKIQEYIIKNDLVKETGDIYPLEHDLACACYLASEIYYLLSNESECLELEMCEVPVKEPGPVGGTRRFTHFYLRDTKNNRVIDITEEQFTDYPHDSVEIPYEDGQHRELSESEISERAKRAANRLKN
jgi:hypothetical protein